MSSEHNDYDNFLKALFEKSKDSEQETIVVPWQEKVAMISGRPGYYCTDLSVSIFDIAMTRAQEMIRLAGSRSIEHIDIPQLMARDMDDGALLVDVAPFLYVCWATGNARPIFEYFAQCGQYFSGTGIVDAINDALGEEADEHNDRFGVEPEALNEWISALGNSGHGHLRSMSHFIAARRDYFGADVNRFDEDGDILEEYLDDAEMFDGMR
ncbi:hypothetical protein G6L37_00440 [Agrobacterium rubi]|nr:hypothetical protein [Agrobacterium rubi]NTF23857.1 hypothetical protein [Agrobacterium rubi]